MNMHPSQKKKIAMWVAVCGVMTLVVTLWALLLPMQLEGGILIGAREISRWQVYRPQAESVSKSWEETMDKWRKAMEDASAVVNAEAQVGDGSSVPEDQIQKLKAKIEAASSRNGSKQLPQTDEVQKE